MQTSILNIVFVLGVFFPTLVVAHACPKPAAPTIPDPAHATDAEMSRALKELEAYTPAINAYLDCTYAEYATSKEQGEALFKRWNDVFDAYSKNQ